MVFSVLLPVPHRLLDSGADPKRLDNKALRIYCNFPALA